MIAAGSLPLLVALVRSDQPAVQISASNTLQVLAINSQQNKRASIAAGVVPILTYMLRSGQPAAQAPAVNALWVITCNSQHNKNAITAAGRLAQVRSAAASEASSIRFVGPLLVSDHLAFQNATTEKLGLLANSSE